MVALISFLLNVVASLFKSKSRLEAENAALRHQLIVLQRKVRGRVLFTDSDRLFFVRLYRWFPSVLKAVTIIRPETLVRWHRAGFRRYWRWKSRSLGGRPQVDADLRALIRLELLPQEGDAGSFGEDGIVRGSASHLEQLAHRALMHLGILAQINAREIEAESVGRATQAAQPTTRQRRRAVRRE